MATLRKLITDQDFQEAVDQELQVRVFQHNLIVDHRCIVIRFDEGNVITQSNVSDLSYYSRSECEFFLLKK